MATATCSFRAWERNFSRNIYISTLDWLLYPKKWPYLHPIIQLNVKTVTSQSQSQSQLSALLSHDYYYYNNWYCCCLSLSVRYLCFPCFPVLLFQPPFQSIWSSAHTPPISAFTLKLTSLTPLCLAVLAIPWTLQSSKPEGNPFCRRNDNFSFLSRHPHHHPPLTPFLSIIFINISP